MLGGRMSLEQLGGNKRFLEGLIRDRVVAQEAARLGLAASDAEVAEKIAAVTNSSAVVGNERYMESITARYGNIEKFEQSVRDSIAQRETQSLYNRQRESSDQKCRMTISARIQSST